MAREGDHLKTEKRSVARWLSGRTVGKGEKKRRDDWIFLKEKYDLALNLRKPFERRWLINLSFLSGRQYVFYNQTAESLQQILIRKGKLRIVDNKLLPRYRKQVSRLIRNSPTATVVPNSNDQEDIEAARSGTKFLEHFQRNDKTKGKLRELAGWIYGCGNGFMSDGWNPMKGPVGLDEGSGDLVYEGDAECGVWSPFEIGVPAAGLGDTDLHRMPWMMRMKFRPLEYIASKYKKGNTVTSEQRPPNTIDIGMLWNPAAEALHELPGATLMELYVQPCDIYKEGLFLVGANGVILHKDKYPFDFYHMEHFKDIEVPGIFWGMATLEGGIWLQKIQNKTVSDIIEFNKVMARGKYLIPRGSKMETIPDDTHGQRLLYTPVMGHKPEILSMKSVPPTYDKALGIVQMGLMELFHQHEVSQGTNRSDIRSGEMVELLLEADHEGNVPTHAVFEESLEAVFGRILRRVQKGYKTERMIKIRGEGEDFEVFSFKGADLRNNTDVFVKRESSLPDSRSARNRRVLQRFEATLYGDPNDPAVKRKVLKMLDDAIVKDIYSEIHLDEQNASLENRTLLAQPGVALMPNMYDDHSVHLREHRRFKKSRLYQKLKQEDYKRSLMVDLTFQSHEAVHQKFLEEALQKQERKIINLERRKKEGGRR